MPRGRPTHLLGGEGIAPSLASRHEAVHVHSGGAGRPRLARGDRGRPRDPARRPNTGGVLHRRRGRPRARRVPARRGALAGARAPPAFGARLLRLRRAREECGARHGPAGRARRVVRDPGLLLLEPGRDLRAGGRDPVPRGFRGARLRARGGGGDRRRGTDRRLHDHERLVCPRPSAARDEDRARAGKGKGLRDLAGADRRHPGRARRPAPGDGRPRERRGALPRKSRRHVPLRGRQSSPTRGTTPSSGPGTSSAPAPSAPAASSSTATSAGSGPATRSSSRSRGSAF